MSRQTAYDIDTCEWDSSDDEQYWLTDGRATAAFLSKPRQFQSTKRSKLLENFPELDNDYSGLLHLAMAAPPAHEPQLERQLEATVLTSVTSQQQDTTKQLEDKDSHQCVQYASLQPHQTLDDVDTQEDEVASLDQPATHQTMIVLHGLTGKIWMLSAF